MDIDKYLEVPVNTKAMSRTTVSVKTVPPLLLITAPGIDALEEVLLLAGKKPEVHLTIVSLGQGQASTVKLINSILYIVLSPVIRPRSSCQVFATDTHLSSS